MLIEVISMFLPLGFTWPFAEVRESSAFFLMGLGDDAARAPFLYGSAPDIVG
jgi:hypothetical protein